MAYLLSVIIILTSSFSSIISPNYQQMTPEGCGIEYRYVDENGDWYDMGNIYHTTCPMELCPPQAPNRIVVDYWNGAQDARCEGSPQPPDKPGVNPGPYCLGGNARQVSLAPSGGDNHQLEMSPGGMVSLGNNTAHIFTGLQHGQGYRFRGQSLNGENGSGWSDWSGLVYQDQRPPTTNISLVGVTGQGGWYTGNVSITLPSTDEGCLGSAQTHYSVNGGAYIGGNSFILSQEGIHTINFYSTDGHNQEALKSRTVSIDKTAPLITVLPNRLADVGNWWNSPVVMTVTASDPTSGITSRQYSTDNINWHSANNPITLSQDGIYNFDGRAVNGAGLINHDGVVIQLDRTPPTLNIVPDRPADGNNGWWVGNVTITLQASDAMSGINDIVYSLNGGVFQTYTAPFTLSNNGITTVDVVVRDNAGNIRSNQLVVPIDKINPVVSIGLDGDVIDDGWYYDSPTIRATYSDQPSGVEGIYLDWVGGTVELYQGAFQIHNEGWHRFDYIARDFAGNESAPQTIEFGIDRTPPTLDIVPDRPNDGDNGWWLDDVTITLDAFDSFSGIYGTQYSLDQGLTWLPYTAPFTLSDSNIHTIHAITRDFSNNITTTELTVPLDKERPVIDVEMLGTIIRDIWYATPPQVLFHADDLMSGLEGVYLDWGDGNRITYQGQFKVDVDGVYQLTYIARDFAGNESTPQTIVFGLDQVSPSLNILTDRSPDGDNNWWVGDVTVSLDLLDETSGIHTTLYSLDQGETWKRYISPITFSRDGINTIHVITRDFSDNTTTAELTIPLDKELPHVEIVFLNEAKHDIWYSNPAAFLANFRDGVSGMEGVHIGWNRSNFQRYFAPFQTGHEGINSFTYYAQDHAGNQSAYQSITVGIDMSAPVVTDFDIQCNPANIIVSGNISDTYSGLWYVSLTVNNDVIAHDVLNTQDAIDYSQELSPTQNNILLKVVDLVGNETHINGSCFDAYVVTTILPPPPVPPIDTVGPDDYLTWPPYVAPPVGTSPSDRTSFILPTLEIWKDNTPFNDEPVQQVTYPTVTIPNHIIWEDTDNYHLPVSMPPVIVNHTIPFLLPPEIWRDEDATSQQVVTTTLPPIIWVDDVAPNVSEQVVIPEAQPVEQDQVDKALAMMATLATVGAGLVVTTTSRKRQEEEEEEEEQKDRLAKQTELDDALAKQQAHLKKNMAENLAKQQAAQAVHVVEQAMSDWMKTYLDLASSYETRVNAWHDAKARIEIQEIVKQLEDASKVLSKHMSVKDLLQLNDDLKFLNHAIEQKDTLTTISDSLYKTIKSYENVMAKAVIVANTSNGSKPADNKTKASGKSSDIGSSSSSIKNHTIKSKNTFKIPDIVPTPIPFWHTSDIPPIEGQKPLRTIYGPTYVLGDGTEEMERQYEEIYKTVGYQRYLSDEFGVKLEDWMTDTDNGDPLRWNLDALKSNNKPYWDLNATYVAYLATLDTANALYEATKSINFPFLDDIILPKDIFQGVLGTEIVLSLGIKDVTQSNNKIIFDKVTSDLKWNIVGEYGQLLNRNSLGFGVRQLETYGIVDNHGNIMSSYVTDYFGTLLRWDGSGKGLPNLTDFNGPRGNDSYSNPETEWADMFKQWVFYTNLASENGVDAILTMLDTINPILMLPPPQLFDGGRNTELMYKWYLVISSGGDIKDFENIPFEKLEEKVLKVLFYDYGYIPDEFVNTIESQYPNIIKDLEAVYNHNITERDDYRYTIQARLNSMDFFVKETTQIAHQWQSELFRQQLIDQIKDLDQYINDIPIIFIENQPITLAYALANSKDLEIYHGTNQYFLSGKVDPIMFLLWDKYNNDRDNNWDNLSASELHDAYNRQRTLLLKSLLVQENNLLRENDPTWQYIGVQDTYSLLYVVSSAIQILSNKEIFDLINSDNPDTITSFYDSDRVFGQYDYLNNPLPGSSIISRTEALSWQLNLGLLVASMLSEPLDWVLSSIDIADAIFDKRWEDAFAISAFMIFPFLSGKMYFSPDDIIGGSSYLVRRASINSSNMDRISNLTNNLSLTFDNNLEILSQYVKSDINIPINNMDRRTLNGFINNDSFFANYRPDNVSLDFYIDTYMYNGRATFVTAAENAHPTSFNASILHGTVADAVKVDPERFSFRVAQDGEQMHHIVPALHPSASDLVTHMENLGIQRNSAFNGVGLTASLHPHPLHSYNSAYIDSILEPILSTRTSGDLQSVLDQIARTLDSANIHNPDMVFDEDFLVELFEEISNIRPQ